MNEQQLATVPTGPLALSTFEDLERFSKTVAESGMFGITKPAQAMCLFAICQSEGIHYLQALRRYHIIEGKPSMKADAMQGEFLAKGGAVIWHVRTDEMVAATFLRTSTRGENPEVRKRAVARFEALWDLQNEEDSTKRASLVVEVAKLSMDGEETIIRTIEDADAKKLSMRYNKEKNPPVWERKTNWEQSPRQMLTARVITEGVRLINPGLIAGIYTPEEIEDTVARPQLKEGADKASMEAIMNQHLEDAKNANGAERQRLLGLAAEMRVKIADLEMRSSMEPVMEKWIQSAEERKNAIPENNIVEGDQLPGLEEHQGNLPKETAVEAPVELAWQDYRIQHVKSGSYKGKKLGQLDKDEIAVLFEKRCIPHLASENVQLRQEAEYIKLAYEASADKK